MDSLPLQIVDDDRRSTQRIPIDSLAVVNSNSRTRTTRLVNISAGGALIGPLFGVAVGDRTTLTVPGYGDIQGRVARVTDDNYAAICFSPDPQFHTLCQERRGELLERINTSQMAFHNPHASRQYTAS